MSSRSSCAYATLRWPVTLALNGVCGAANGRAIASPLRARLTVSTTKDRVVGTHVDQLQRPSGELHRAADRDLESAAAADTLDRIGSGRVGFGTAQLRHEVGTGHAVHTGVMHLRHDRQPATCVRVRVGARDVLDDPHLPQRATAIQWQRGDVTADLRQFLAAARRRKADAVQVPVDVEVFVLNPHRMVRIESAVGELLAGIAASP